MLNSEYNIMVTIPFYHRLENKAFKLRYAVDKAREEHGDFFMYHSDPSGALYTVRQIIHRRVENNEEIVAFMRDERLDQEGADNLLKKLDALPKTDLIPLRSKNPHIEKIIDCILKGKPHPIRLT